MKTTDFQSMNSPHFVVYRCVRQIVHAADQLGNDVLYFIGQVDVLAKPHNL